MKYGCLRWNETDRTYWCEDEEAPSDDPIVDSDYISDDEYERLSEILYPTSTIKDNFITRFRLWRFIISRASAWGGTNF
jgi:hypothetical protein